MTLEDFAHRCLMIKAGNVELAIPCCANCQYYTQEKDIGGIKGFTSSLLSGLINHVYNGGSAKVVKKVEGKDGVEFFCETTGEFISEEEAEQIRCENLSKENLSKQESISYTYFCKHPAQESEDQFVEAWLETKPEDFCSRWEERTC